MSSTLPGADVRGFYAALGIALPGWAQQEASIACFANPDAHAHGDRDPSCSVNVETGVWHCWGCEAAGGPYDAALARGRSPRDAIDLMIAYLLTTRRAGPNSDRASRAAPRRPAPSPDGPGRLAHSWPSMSSSSRRRTLGWRLCVGRRGCCATSSGVCGRAPPCSTSGAVGSAVE